MLKCKLIVFSTVGFSFAGLNQFGMLFFYLKLILSVKVSELCILHDMLTFKLVCQNSIDIVLLCYLQLGLLSVTTGQHLQFSSCKDIEEGPEDCIGSLFFKG